MFGGSRQFPLKWKRCGPNYDDLIKEKKLTNINFKTKKQTYQHKNKSQKKLTLNVYLSDNLFLHSYVFFLFNHDTQ